MACDGNTKVWELAAREILRLDGARGTTVRVTRGTLWLTLENDPRDIVLTTGDSFTIDRGGLTVIEAQGNATYARKPGTSTRRESFRAPRACASGSQR